MLDYLNTFATALVVVLTVLLAAAFCVNVLAECVACFFAALARIKTYLNSLL